MMKWNDEAWQEYRTEAIAFTSWISVIAVVGIIGNSIILARYPIPPDGCRTSIVFLVKALALTDLMNCVLIPYTICFELSLVQNEVACKAMEMVRHIAASMSVMQLMLVAVEKYFLICRPLQPFARHTFERATFALLCCVTLMNTPVLFLATTQDPGTERQNRKYFDMRLPTCYVDTSASVASASHALLGLFMYWGAVVVMIASYACILRALKLRNQNKMAAKKQFNRSPIRNDVIAQVRDEGNDNAVFESSEVIATDDVTITVNRENENERADVTGEQRNSPRNDVTSQFARAIRSVWIFLVITVLFGVSWTPFWLLRIGVVAYNPNISYTFLINNALNFFVFFALVREFRHRVLCL